MKKYFVTIKSMTIKKALQASTCFIGLFISNITPAGETINFLEEHSVIHHKITEGGDAWIHTFGNITIVEILLISKSCNIKIIETKKHDLPNQIYKQTAAERTNVLINGGFFGYNKEGKYVPIGLVRSNNKRLNALIPWSSGGVFVSSGRIVDIIPAKQAINAGRWPEAIQSKPIIILDNKVDVGLNLRDDDYNRSAIGITIDNSIYITGMFDTFGEAGTLLEFSNIMLSAASARGIHLKSAIAMDGGPGAHIYIPSISQNFGEGGKTYVPNIISISECK